MKVALFLAVVLAYSLATLAFYWALVYPEPKRFGSALWLRRSLLGLSGLHFADIAFRSAVTRTCPVASAEFALSLVALAAIGTFLGWARTEKQLSIGVVVVPVACAMFIASEFLGAYDSRLNIPGWFIAFHVSANLLSVGLFVLAAAAAITYLLQSSRLKAKRASVHGRQFLGLSGLEALSHRFLGIGLGLMTIGVVSGAVFAERLSHGGFTTVRVVLSYVCWFVAAVVVIGQRATGWHGRKVAWGTIVSAILAIGVVIIYALTSEGLS
jgi:ABC-type uncharacterized transport system permease subunit